MAQSVCVIVSAVDRERLEAVVADRNQRQKYVERARIVLASADRGPAQRVAQGIGLSRPTVWRWQQRFAEAGVEGLLRDKTRKPGKAPIAADKAAQLVALTCTEPPHQATHWTGRRWASRCALCSTPGGRISCSSIGYALSGGRATWRLRPSSPTLWASTSTRRRMR